VAYDIEKILEFDDAFQEEFVDVGNRLIPILKVSNFPCTAQTLIGLMGTSNSIKLGIFELAEQCHTHLYVIKVLKRTLIEHYLKFYYILFRLLKENTDDVGIEYRKYSRISETLSFINASEVSKKMVGVSTDNQVLKLLKKSHPEFDISKKQLNEITLKWKHRSIIKYIKANTNLIENEKSFLLNLISEYSELSSFIHGGTFAEETYHQAFDSGNLEKLVYNEAFSSSFLCSSMRVHLLLPACKLNEQFQEDIIKLNTMVSGLLAQNT